MPLESGLVGARGEAFSHEVDARWTMAYAAALGDTGPAYLDTAARPDVAAHPLFPVCFEWPAFVERHLLPEMERLAPEERLRGVHATHHVELHRPLRAGLRVETRATLAAVEMRPPGAYQLVRLDSHDAAGEPVCSTWYGTLFRGVRVEGPDRVLDPAPETPGGPIPQGDTGPFEIDVPAGAAHVYSEAARIWNPIHTDAAVARAAGLPGIILHGTASLALAVSRIVSELLGGDPTAVAAIRGRFAAMVPMPQRLRLRVDAGSGGARFELANEAGDLAVRDGYLRTR